MATYNFAILDPRSIPAANEANEKIFTADCGTGKISVPVLGIEVTVRALAARCSLGNIDPQHDDSGSTLSAVEAAAAETPCLIFAALPRREGDETPLPPAREEAAQNFISRWRDRLLGKGGDSE